MPEFFGKNEGGGDKNFFDILSAQDKVYKDAEQESWDFFVKHKQDFYGEIEGNELKLKIGPDQMRRKVISILSNPSLFELSRQQLLELTNFLFDKKEIFFNNLERDEDKKQEMEEAKEIIISKMNELLETKKGPAKIGVGRSIKSVITYFEDIKFLDLPTDQ